MSKYKNEIQNRITDYVEERGWEKLEFINVYNMLCNIGEETGEIWNLIKWMKDDGDLNKLIKKNKAEMIDGIGDLMWCLARLANSLEIDMQEAVEATHAEYEERFPVEIVKTRHGNPKLGGYDGKYDK
ncbi:hypothetical protein GF389_02720 [Candidatus Dojkabacteria bacterium]|nr:hypothetical protein [Candidatus Dojkabacteria bacterium]